MWSCDELAERGAGDEALQHLLTRERGRLDDDEQGREPAEAFGRPTSRLRAKARTTTATTPAIASISAAWSSAGR